MADHHFEITKSAGDGVTRTAVRELDRGDSVRELARILGGARITDAVMDNAAEMRALAEHVKEEIRPDAVQKG